MSYHPYRLALIANERKLLEEMLLLRDKVREAKEEENRLQSSESSHYTKMFQPITNSLAHLKHSQIATSNSSTTTDELSANGNGDGSNELNVSEDKKH